MFIRHSVKNILRSWPKSLLFFLLLTALSVTLCVGMSLTTAIVSFLKDCDDSYTTVALFEYIGVDYPDETVLDPGIAQCIADYDFDSIGKHPAVQNWDPNAIAFGSISGKDANSANQPFKRSLVAVVLIMSYNEYESCYQYTIVKDLLDPDSEPYSGYLFTAGMQLEKGRFYLIHATRSSGITNYNYSRISPFRNATAAHHGMDGSIENMCVDVSSPDGGYIIPDDSVFYKIASTYITFNTGLTVHAVNDMEAFLPVQQAELSVIEGRSFTPDEYNSGAKVCLLPGRLADLLGVKPGGCVELSLAVQAGATKQESYWAGAGFTYSDDYVVVGILSPNDDYRDSIFIPKSGDVDLSANQYSYTLGQARLKNSKAGQFYADMEGALPPRVRMTVYDQGYEAAATPLQDVLRVALILTVVCALTTITMLALFGFLFVYRQRGLTKTMRRIGVTNGGILCYFTFGSGCLALLSAALGATVSYRLSGYFMDIVHQAITNYTQDDLRYSNASLTISKTVEYALKTGFHVFALTALAMFSFAVLACFAFTVVSIRANRLSRRPRSNSEAASPTPEGIACIIEGSSPTSEGMVCVNEDIPPTPEVTSGAFEGSPPTPEGAAIRRAASPSRRVGTVSRSLRGGALKYAWLSVTRGASRSALPVMLCALATALLLQLTSATVAYEESYDQLVRDSDIFGHFTDYRGVWRYGLLLDGTILHNIHQSGALSGISITRSLRYAYDLNSPSENATGYEWETYHDNIAAGPGFIYTNDLAATQEFFGCVELPVAFADGYDLSVFSRIMPDDEPFAGKIDPDTFASAERGPAPCIVSTAFLESSGLAPGDTLDVVTTDGDMLNYVTATIVGSYEKQGAADNIYVPLNEYRWTYFVTTYARRQYTTWYYDIPYSYIHDPDADKDLLRRLSFGSAEFKMRGAEGLKSFKEFLYDQGYSEVNKTRLIRSFITIEDKTFLAAQRAMTQRLWYMQKVFPALYVLLELLAALIPFILIKLRKREAALMRAQGAARHTAFFSLFLEQVMLCLPGALLGMGIWLAVFGKATAAGLILGFIFVLFWLLGAGISAFTLNQSPAKILRAEE